MTEELVGQVRRHLRLYSEEQHGSQTALQVSAVGSLSLLAPVSQKGWGGGRILTGDGASVKYGGTPTS